MSRPPKCRRVEFLPEITYFKPAGIPLCDLEEINLTVEELEAIRLKDFLDLEQEDCADRMGVSRPTYHRILSSARAKIAQALILGKAIKIEGGHYQLVVRRLKCFDCGHIWEVPCRSEACGEVWRCPQCKGENIRRVNADGEQVKCRWQKPCRRMRVEGNEDGEGD